MKYFTPLVASVLVAALGLAPVSPADAAEHLSDAEALARLAKSGSDLSKLHRVEFFLRFPSEDDAARAAFQLEDLAFATTTERDEAADEWVVLASKVMYPVESDLIGLRDKLNIIAAGAHGTYDGWQATLQQR